MTRLLSALLIIAIFCVAFAFIKLSNKDSMEEWKQIQSMHHSRVEALTFPINGEMWVFGGLMDINLEVTDTIEIYNPKTKKWRIHGNNMPIKRTHNSAARVGNVLWFVGGFVEHGLGAASDLTLLYFINEDRWEFGPSFPFKIAAGGLAYADGKLHFFNGTLADRQTSSTLHYSIDPNVIFEEDFDPAYTAYWQYEGNVPNARVHYKAISHNDKIYLIGGQDGHDGKTRDMNIVDIYNVKTKQWSVASPFPTAISHAECGSFKHNGKFYAMGGKNHFELSLHAIFEYSPEEDKWSEVGNLPISILCPSAAIINEELIIAGGSHESYLFMTNKAYVTPTSSFRHINER